MITREDFVSGKNTFHEYYGQFVTEAIKRDVLSKISMEELLKSTDPHLNDIALKRWEKIPAYVNYAAIRATGDVNAQTISNFICVVKTAAKQLIESHHENNKK